ncbi:MAG: hypothetical protein IKC38_07110 [Clostridia bacterium]|nr:hypothetical protein [Clostridia bacterium]
MISATGGRFRGRKGIAIELAIFALVTIFAVCLMIVSTSVIQYGKRISMERQMDREAQLEQIGENFCQTAVVGDISWESTFPDYSISFEGQGIRTMTVTSKDNPEDVLLSIAVQVSNNACTVIKWTKE